MADQVTGDILALYKQFLVDPSWATHVGVPAAYIDRLAVFPCMEPKIVSAKLGKFMFDVYAFPFVRGAELASLQRVLDGVHFSERNGLMVLPVTAVLDGCPCYLPMVLPEKGLVSLDEQYMGSHKATDEWVRSSWMLFQPSAERFAALANVSVTLHIDGPRLFSTYRSRADEVHVFVGIAPTGEFVQRMASRSCGKAIAKDGGPVDVYGPTPGRGVVFTDEQQEPAVQIIGNNWFLLPPLVSTLHAGSPELFERLLAIAWEGWRSSGEWKRAGNPAWVPDAQAEAMTRERFTMGYASLVAEVPAQFDAKIKKIDDLVDEMRKEIAKQLRNRLKFSMMRDGFMTSMKTIDIVFRMNADFRRLSEMPGIASFWFDEERALMVQTTWLVCTHAGMRKAVGRYGIRIGENGVVSVWCEEPAIASGDPHPHMPKDASPCFGNAGDAITEAAGEMRLADTVSHVIEWLTEGYSPDTTLVPIEMWPPAGEDGRPLPYDVQDIIGLLPNPELRDIAPPESAESDDTEGEAQGEVVTHVAT